MFAKESGTEVNSMFAWIDEACIDQETWAKHPDIGMAFVYGKVDHSPIANPFTLIKP